MRSRRIDDFVVGLVVIAAIILVVGATLWVQGTDFSDRRTVEARFREVGNAQVGSAVVVRGVSSGRLDAVELAPGGWVTVRLKLDEGVRLPPDPVVLLGQSTLFGEWQATITERSGLPADREVQRQIEEASGAPGLLPGATLPDVAQLTAVAGRIAGDMATVADRFQVAFDDSAARDIRASIRDVAAVASVLARTVERQSGNLDDITRQVAGGVGALSAAAASVESVAGRIDSSTASGQLRSLVDDAAAAAASMRAAAGELRTLSGDLATTQLRLDSLLASSQSVMRSVDDGRGSLGLLVNDPSLYVQTDSLVRQLRVLIDDFQRNPKRYVGIRIF